MAFHKIIVFIKKQINYSDLFEELEDASFRLSSTLSCINCSRAASAS